MSGTTKKQLERQSPWSWRFLIRVIGDYWARKEFSPRNNSKWWSWDEMKFVKPKTRWRRMLVPQGSSSHSWNNLYMGVGICRGSQKLKYKNRGQAREVWGFLLHVICWSLSFLLAFGRNQPIYWIVNTFCISADDKGVSWPIHHHVGRSHPDHRDKRCCHKVAGCSSPHFAIAIYWCKDSQRGCRSVWFKEQW